MRSYLILFLFAAALFCTHGSFLPLWIAVLPIGLSLALCNFRSFGAGPVWRDPAVAVICITLFSVSLVLGLPVETVMPTRILLYPDDPAFLLPMQILFAISGALAIGLAAITWTRCSRPRVATLLWALAAGCALAGLALVVSASPHPKIDVWSLHQEAANALAHFRNPYTEKYTNIYSAEESARLTPFGTNFAYLPGVVIWMTPWSLCGLDTRYSLVFAYGLTALLLFLIARATRPEARDFKSYAPSLLMLLFPVAPFFIEQGWNDGLTVLCFTLAAYAFVTRRALGLYIAVNALLLLKQYNIAYAPFLLVLAYVRFPQKWWKLLFKCCIGAVAIAAIFLALDWRAFLGSLWGLHFLKYSDVHQVFSDRQDAFSIMNWFSVMIGTKSSWFFLFPVGLIGLGLVWRTWKGFSLAAFFRALGALSIAMFAFAPLAFANYYEFAMSFIFLDLALQTAADSESVIPSLFSGTTFAFIATRSIALFSLPIQLPDTIYYNQIASAMLQGYRPYFNFKYEYPPLSIFPLYLPKLIADAIGSPLTGDAAVMAYHQLHTLLYVAIDALFYVWLARLRRRGEISGLGVKLYVFGGFCLAQLMYARLDLLMGVLLFAAAYFATTRKPLRTYISLTLGVFFKLVPIIAGPLLLWSTLVGDFSWRTALKRVSWLLGCGLLALGISYAVYDTNFLSFLGYHTGRGIQLETIWASAAFVGSQIFPDWIAPVQKGVSANSWSLITDNAILISLANSAFIVLLLILYTIARWRFQPERIGRLVFMCLLIFLSFGKVLSPQFMIWLICIIPICNYTWQGWRQRTLLVSLGISLVLTGYLVFDYANFANLQTPIWWMVVVRNVLLLLMLALAFTEEWLSGSVPHEVEAC